MYKENWTRDFTPKTGGRPASKQPRSLGKDALTSFWKVAI